MPFRSLAIHVETLRAERSRLAADLENKRRTIAAMRPWSWQRFAVGIALPFSLVGVATMIAMVYIAFELSARSAW